MPVEARILDANANRAREALRVLEDAARFAIDDQGLTARLKALRHDLRAAIDRLPAGWLEANRDVSRDVGTSVTAPDEMERAGLVEVVAAAGKRLGEALRVIEETAKTIEPSVARLAQGIRYRSYELEQALLGRMGSGRRIQWRLCVILTESACTRPWRDVLKAAIGGGADCIQVREKTFGGADLARRVDEVISVARPRGAAVIVNDRPDVAMACGAEGCHLGREDLSIAGARRVAGRTLLLGASAHDLEEAAAATIAGADYCGVGAMFTSTTRAVPPAGPAWLEAFLARYPGVPHLAIGGITPENVALLAQKGARGVAVCASVCGAARPEDAARRLREALEAAPAERPVGALRT